MNLKQKHQEIIGLLKAEEYTKATPLALELLAATNHNDDNDDDDDDDDDDESLSFKILSVINGEFEDEPTPEKFAFSKSVVDRAWELPPKGLAGKVQQESRCYCEQYENELPIEENIAIRERHISTLNEFSQIHNVREMVLFLVGSGHYKYAWEKLEALYPLDESEYWLFKSHMLRHGLGADKNIFDAFTAEVKSVQCFSPDIVRYTGYAYFYELLDDADLLFEYRTESENFNMDMEGFIWYLANLKDATQMHSMVQTIKDMGMLEDFEER